MKPEIFGYNYGDYEFEEKMSITKRCPEFVCFAPKNYFALDKDRNVVKQGFKGINMGKKEDNIQGDKYISMEILTKYLTDKNLLSLINLARNNFYKSCKLSCIDYTKKKEKKDLEFDQNMVKIVFEELNLEQQHDLYHHYLLKEGFINDDVKDKFTSDIFTKGNAYVVCSLLRKIRNDQANGLKKGMSIYQNYLLKEVRVSKRELGESRIIN